MKQVVLLGTAPSSMLLAPFGNDEWEIWACSPGTMQIPRCDRRYELHRWEPGKEWFPASYVEMLCNAEYPVVLSAPVPSVKNGVVLDWKKHIAEFGPYFFTSSLAWMMAEAITEGYERIALYGVDMASTSEYHDQRMGVHYFGMIARMMGIEVGTPPESDLFRPAPLYGVCENSHIWIKQTARARELAARKREALEKAEKAQQEITFLSGALDDLDWQCHSVAGSYDTMHCETTEPDLPTILAEIEFPAKNIPEYTVYADESVEGQSDGD